MKNNLFSKHFHFMAILLLGLFFNNAGAFGADGKVDSLKVHLQHKLEDTTRINTLIALAREFTYSKPDTFFLILTQALNISETINWKKGKAASFRNIGVFYMYKGNYAKALEFYHKALKIDEERVVLGEEGGKKGVAVSLGNIGIVYLYLGDYPKSLDYYFKALKLDEELINKNGIARHLGNIGIVFRLQGDFSQSLNYYFKALKIKEEMADKKEISSTQINIGNVYYDQKNYPKAIEFYFRALKIMEELDYKNGIASILVNLGSVYTELYEKTEKKTQMGVAHADSIRGIGENGQAISAGTLLDLAISYHERAYVIHREIGAKSEIASSLSVMGDILIQQQKLKQALSFFQRSYALADSIGALSMKMNAAQRIYSTYKKLDRFDHALTWHEIYLTHKDSLFNEEKQNEIGKVEAGYEYEKELFVREKEQEKKDLAAFEESKRQKLISFSASGAAALMLLLAMIAIRGYRNKQKANLLLEDKNLIIEEKNKDITDSINYAKNIQKAMLPFEERIKKAFASFPMVQNFVKEQESSRYFILFKPKDIVSGDFYWFMEKGENIFLAVVDCTGHGVPGAFMSMIGSAILNHVVGEQNIIRADLILNEMHKQVRTALKQEDTNNKDGMDMVLCVINRKQKKLEFAGAMNPLYIVKDNNLETIKGDKQAIGGSQDELERIFTLHTIALEGVVNIYLSTDGFADQFGGPRGKKFKYSKLRELLQDNAEKLMEQQKTELDNAFEHWKGDLEQVDDVCIVGVRL